jgi:dTDP-4-amino-4,6-dideoxygalactose transaminase
MTETIPFLDLKRQTDQLGSELAAAIGRVLESGRFVLGEEVAAFEREFAAYCGAEEAVGIASGTDAITLALSALGIGAGAEVVTAANTCVPTVVGIERSGATPVLADADPVTAMLDPASVAEVLTERTRAVVAVHLYGRCAEMEPLRSLARRHDLRLVEDAAQAHGARLDGARVGTLADAAAFSFYPTKNLGALGDAGAVVTNDTSVAERLRVLRSYGETRERTSSLRGFNSRLDSLQAAVLRAKLPFLDEWNDRRRELAKLYLEQLEDVGVELPPLEPQERHVFHLFVVRVQRRDEVRAELSARGVEAAVHYPLPVHRHPAYAHLGAERSFPVSERLCNEVLSLPLYPQLADAEVARVVDALREVIRTRVTIVR